jgi:diguanylate cyclase (GGDEF)-like protein
MGINLPRRKTIGGKIAALIALSVFSAMILLALFLGALQLNTSVQDKKTQLESTAYIYASALAENIESQDRSAAQKVLRSIARVPNILYAAAINSNGETIASMGNVTFLISDQVEGQPNIFKLLTKGNMPIAVDIVRGDEKIGKLVVLGDIRDIRSQLFWTLVTTALASIVAALLAFPISRPLRNRIVDPIELLTKAMRKMRETRSFEKATIAEAEGETKVLVETFNSMINDIRQRDASLRQLAYFDPLTGLPNRANFQRTLEDSYKSKTSSAAYFIFDIDNFHAINDAMGHGIGDALLMDVAARLKSELPDNGSIARIGGDEFAAIVPGATTTTLAHDALAKMISTLYEPVKILGHEIHASVSTGISLISEESISPAEIQRQLDLALQDAKSSSANRVSFFRSEMVEALNEEAELVKGLRAALAQNQITAFFQPVVNLETGYVEGFEALARWIDPIKGHIPPSKFIPAAEKAGLISALGEEILKIACQQAKSWHDAGKPGWTVAVNVSTAQILQLGFVDHVREVLADTNLPAHLLCLELTESMFVGKSMNIVQKMLENFRVLGIMTALDDFGTGYSSLSYLEHLPFDKLKIDRAFVKNAQEGNKNTELLKGIINLAHGLGMVVVAEGAETDTELNVLRRFKADSVQGYVISKPLPAHQAEMAADLHDKNNYEKMQQTA